MIAENRMTVPWDWCRTHIVDPGSAWPGSLVVADAPPEVEAKVGGPISIVEYEMFQPNTDADQQARFCKSQLEGVVIQRNIIDYNGGKSTGTGRGTTVRQHYEDAWKTHRLECLDTAHHFQYSSDEMAGGLMAVRHRLKPLGTGRPSLRFMPTCTQFPDQMEGYLKNLDNNDKPIDDKPAPKQIDPLCDCIRYHCVGKYPYRRPPEPSLVISGAFRLWEDEFAPRKRTDGNSVYCGPGGVHSQN